LLKYTVVQSVAAQRAGSLAVGRAAQERFADVFTLGLRTMRRVHLR